MAFENIFLSYFIKERNRIKKKKRKNENNYSSWLKSSLLTHEERKKKKKKIGETITSMHRQGEYTNNMKNRTTERMNGLVLFLDREYISSNNRGTVLKIAPERVSAAKTAALFSRSPSHVARNYTIRPIW